MPCVGVSLRHDEARMPSICKSVNFKMLAFFSDSHGSIINVVTNICWQTAMLHLLYSCSYVRILTQIWKLLPITITLPSCCPWFWCVLCSCAFTSGALLVIIKPFCSPFTSSHGGSFHTLVINHWTTTPIKCYIAVSALVPWKILIIENCSSIRHLTLWST